MTNVFVFIFLEVFSRFTYIRHTHTLARNGNVNYVFMGIGNVCLEVFYINTIIYALAVRVKSAGKLNSPNLQTRAPLGSGFHVFMAEINICYDYTAAAFKSPNRTVYLISLQP